MGSNGRIFDLVSGQQILFGFFSFGSRMQAQSSFTCKKSDVNRSFVKSLKGNPPNPLSPHHSDRGGREHSFNQSAIAHMTGFILCFYDGDNYSE